MKLLTLTARDRRVLAVGLLAVVLALAYLVLLHGWFVAPWLAVRGEMADLRATQSRYAALLAAEPALRARVAALDTRTTADSAFWGGGDPGSATAALMQRISDVVAANATGGSCSIDRKLLEPDPPAITGDPYRRAAVTVELRCDMQPLVAVLRALEDGTPYAFVEDLSIYRSPVAAQQPNVPPLDVQLTLAGYLRPLHAPATAVPAGTGAP